MNILIVPTAYPNIYNPYSSIFVQDQAETLANNGVNTYVAGAIPISFKEVWKNKLLKFGKYTFKKDGVNVELFLYPAIPKMRKLNQFIRYILNKRLIEKSIKKSNIDLIHVHNSTAGKVALWVKEKYNIPYCVTEHSSLFSRNMISEEDIKQYQNIYKNSSKNIAVSEKFCTLLKKIYNLEFSFIPNVVNTNYFVNKQKEKSKIFRFINIANLNTNKNQILLLRAFHRSFKGNKNIKLFIIGAGPEYSNLTKEVKELRISEQVTLYGSATREEILKELQNSDVFVLSSKYETFGVVLIEAMSCGLPVLSTKCGGPESIVENKKLGLLVENNDEADLAKAMKESYKTRYDSNTIRDYAIQNFSQNVIAGKLIRVYKDVINEKNSQHSL